MARAPSADGLPTIEGYAAKAGRSIMGSEGPAYWATIFRGGKKVGEAHEAGEGGPVTFYFDDPEETRLFNEAAARVVTDTEHEQDSALLAMLLDYADRVKSLTKWTAKGYTTFIEAYQWSVWIGGKFIPGQGTLMGYMKGYDDHMVESLKQKKYDAARRVNADGTYSEWLYKPAPEAGA